MAYTQMGIINLALSRIGVKKIAAIDEDSVQRIAATEIWDYIRDEVLEAREWKFAKTRNEIGIYILRLTDENGIYFVDENGATITVSDGLSYGNQYAYELPTDFLRIAKGTKLYPAVYFESRGGITWLIESLYDVAGDGLEHLVLTTDFYVADTPVYITYIRKVTNILAWTPAFIKTFAFRLAQELALPLTEGMQKYQAMGILYDKAMQEADGITQSMDYLEDEMGKSDWVNAGRSG